MKSVKYITLCVSSLAVSTALAQERTLEEITVTAQKREQAITDVSLTINAFTGDLMRANQDRVGDADDLAAATNLAERIGAAVLEDEAALRRSAPNVIELNPPPKTQADNSAMTTARPRAFRRSLLSGVLAASIALIAVVVARFVNDTPPTFTSASNVALADKSSVEPLRLTERAPSGAVQLQRYLVNHAEFSRATSQGVMPYARVVGYRNGVDERRR